jgi:hypothetical protein
MAGASFGMGLGGLAGLAQQQGILRSGADMQRQQAAMMGIAMQQITSTSSNAVISTTISKPKTIKEELQHEVDRWLEDVDL